MKWVVYTDQGVFRDVFALTEIGAVHKVEAAKYGRIRIFKVVRQAD